MLTHLCKGGGLHNKFVSSDMQMVSMVAKMEVDTPSYRQPQLLQKHFSLLVEQILQVLKCQSVTVTVTV